MCLRTTLPISHSSEFQAAPIPPSSSGGWLFACKGLLRSQDAERAVTSRPSPSDLLPMNTPSGDVPPRRLADRKLSSIGCSCSPHTAQDSEFQSNTCDSAGAPLLPLHPAFLLYLVPPPSLALIKGSEVNNAVLQILNIRQVSTSSPPRYRLRMSDGQHTWSSFLLATQLNNLTEDNLVPNSVFLVKKSIKNTLTDGRSVVILLDMEMLQSAEETGGKIGDPTPYETVVKRSSSQESVSSTLFPASPPSAAEPGPSKWNKSNRSPPRGQGSGFVGKSPMKASPSKFSPMRHHPWRHHP
ncbi:hypothetical protein F7725_006821 [Dissostichus mawsoni]|uniref:Replication factor-A protein 1 N-terminal domain-containing protein n=1 Tax=Dissostichus mawsoni TaxID=36200 RepID=A0A7J5XWR8_DISMA|nr:hypothetical protein F7725_006821 [Dissostichus mawsoni]